MSIRETINKNPKVGVAVAVTALLAGFFVHRMLVPDGKPGMPRSAYYTTDEGKTTFVDDFEKAYPFEHDGKTAYRAGMVRYGKEKPFVAFLQRYNDAGKKKVVDLLASRPPDLEQQLQALYETSVEVKKPGDTQWHRVTSGKGAAIVGTQSPSGQFPDIVFP